MLRQGRRCANNRDGACRPLASDTPGHPARGRTVIAAGLLAHGSKPCVRLPAARAAVTSNGQGSPLTVAGAASDLRNDRRSPDSLLAPGLERPAEPRCEGYAGTARSRSKGKLPTVRTQTAGATAVGKGHADIAALIRAAVRRAWACERLTDAVRRKISFAVFTRIPCLCRTGPVIHTASRLTSNPPAHQM